MQRQCNKNKNKNVQHDKRVENKAERLKKTQKNSIEIPVQNFQNVEKLESNSNTLKTEQAIRVIQQVIRERFLQQPVNTTPDPQNADSEKRSLLLQMCKKLEKGDNGKKQENNLPVALFSNLKMLMQQTQLPNPILDEVSNSDDDEEYIEYIFQPRNYFLVCLCNYCKCELQQLTPVACDRCSLIYYCSPQHMQFDRKEHRNFCRAVEHVADNNGGQIFRNSGTFSADEFRSYRLVILQQIESTLDRPLTIEEKEAILFPRICLDTKCRENNIKKLQDCQKCSQVAFCRDKPDHFKSNHQIYCEFYCLFKKLIMQQHKFGRIEPNLTTKVLKYFPDKCINTSLLLHKLSLGLLLKN